MTHRSVPVRTILPHVSYRDVAGAIAWLSRVFGFRERYRYGDPAGGAEMYLGEAYIMLHDEKGNAVPAQLGFGTQSLTVFVADVDAHFARVKREGAEIVEELQETGVYGERQYGVLDLDGHKWLFHSMRGM